MDIVQPKAGEGAAALGDVWEPHYGKQHNTMHSINCKKYSLPEEGKKDKQSEQHFIVHFFFLSFIVPFYVL